jgi:LysR family hydrogen peroxide-inducible transcriptional activator
MNLRDLEYALAVERTSSFTRAAEACNVSQPTLSTQIRKLEDELGVQIFERDGHTIRVTPAGAAILARAKSVVGSAEELVESARSARDPLVGPLRVGMIPTLAPYLLPHILPGARLRLPDSPLVIFEEQTARLEERLTTGQLDAAILATPVSAPGLIETPLFDERLWVALPPADPLAEQTSIASGDIDPATLLLLTEGHCLREHALTLCTSAAAASRAMADLRASSLETLLNLVEAGYGLTIVPALALQGAQIAGGRVVARPLSDENARRSVRLVHRRNTIRLPALNTLAGIVRESAAAAPERGLTTK